MIFTDFAGPGAWAFGAPWQPVVHCGTLWQLVGRELVLEPGCLAACGNLWDGSPGLEAWVIGALWRPVAGCGAGVVALSERLHP